MCYTRNLYLLSPCETIVVDRTVRHGVINQSNRRVLLSLRSFYICNSNGPNSDQTYASRKTRIETFAADVAEI